MLSQIGKIITKSSVITNRLSITMAALIIDYFFQLQLASLIKLKDKYGKKR